MKWFYTAAALLVLAWSAPARADLFSRYQASPEGENVGGAEVAPPDTGESSFHDTATGSVDESGTQYANPANMDYASRVNNNSVLATQASNQYSAGYVPTTVPGGPMGTYPYPAGGSFAAAAGCCQPMAAGAVGLWDDYCSTRNMGKHGLLGGMMCGCGAMFARSQCGCSMQQSACGQPMGAACGCNPCGCRKSMMFSGKYGCGYGSAACGVCGGGQTWNGSMPYDSSERSPSDRVEPVAPTPPTPVPQPEILQSEPQSDDLQTDVPQTDTIGDTAEAEANSSDAAPAKKPARTGLFSNGFRLFPGLLGR